MSHGEKACVTDNEVQGVVQPLIGYLQDIRRALNADLTSGGLESVKSIATNANENAGKVQTALKQLASDLTLSSARVSSIVAQNARPEEKTQ